MTTGERSLNQREKCLGIGDTRHAAQRRFIRRSGDGTIASSSNETVLRCPRVVHMLGMNVREQLLPRLDHYRWERFSESVENDRGIDGDVAEEYASEGSTRARIGCRERGNMKNVVLNGGRILNASRILLWRWVVESEILAKVHGHFLEPFILFPLDQFLRSCIIN